MKKIIFLVLFISFFTLCKAQYTDILDFKGTNSPQGLNPYGNLTLSVTGDTLFGMTAYGGAYSAGNIFCMSSGGYADLYDFSGVDGLYPYGSLILSKDTLYGMTAYGGALGNGCIFAMTENASWFSDIYDFSGYSGGSSPYGSLLVRNDTLWGTTSTGGGTSSYGNVFCIETNGSGYYDVLDFNGSDGAFPYSSLTEAHGYLWGTCSQGGNSGYGDIFVIDPHTLAYSDLFDFNGTNGAYCFGSLIPSVTGDSLFGMTSQGNGYGNVFAYVIGTGFENLFDFSSSNGANPNGDLTVSRGMLYGMTSLGGAYNDGILFSLRINSGLYTDLNDFNGFNGSYPYGSVTFSHNHTKFFGMTTQGNKINDGLIFSYNTLIIDSFRVTNVTCTNGYRGDVSAYVSGGATPYTYLWNPGGATTQSLSGLSAGSYTVTVTDNIGSMDTSVVVISDIILPVSELINVSCYGGDDGVIQVSPSGGTAPYVYSWKGPPPITTGTVTISMAPGPIERGLSAGTYTITVKDSCGDSAFVIATISQPALLIVSDSIVSNVHCSGASTGSIATLVWGGTSPYIYQWSDASSQTTAIATGLSAGTYYITVTDTNGCTAVDSAIISQPSKPPVGVTIARAKNVSCSGSFDGMALALASGGVPPYTYYWTPGSDTTSIVTGLSAGIYTIQITDTRGCNAVAVANISQPTVLTVSDTTIAAITAAYPSGGTPPYSFSWSPGGGTGFMTSGISAGTYTVTVKDFNGCEDSAVIHLKQALSAGLNFSLEYTGTTCGNNPPGANFAIMATSLPNTIFNSCVIDLQYSKNEFYPDSIGLGSNIIFLQGDDFIFYSSPIVTSLSDSVIQIYFGDSTSTSPFGAEITDTPQVLMYVTFTVQSPCQSGYVSFANTLTTMSQSTYTDSAFVGGSYVFSDSAYTTVYTNTIVTSPACGSSISINDFDSPIRAGVGDTLTILGTGFGGSRGTGQVKFRDADSAHYIIPRLNDTDYLSWTDNQIQIRLPSFADSIIPTNLKWPLTLGGGRFTVTNSCGDSAISNLNSNLDTFSIFYNITQNWNYYNFVKKERLLRSTDTSGGYLIRFDSITFPRGSNKRLIFQKAMRDWTCYTGMNWVVGKDTSFRYSPGNFVGTNYVFFTDSLLLPNVVAETNPDPNYCTNYTDVLEQGVIYFNSRFNFIYDSTETMSIPTGFADFYGVCLHELGHFIGLEHVTSPTDLMYYTANVANTSLISAANRITLASMGAAAADTGGGYSVTQSESNPSSCTNYGTVMTGKGTLCYNEYLGINPLNKPNSNTFNIYPNPSNGTFAIESSIDDYTLVVINMLGQRLFTRKINEEKAVINLSTIASGMYFIQEQYENGVSTQKLIIAKNK